MDRAHSDATALGLDLATNVTINVVCRLTDPDKAGKVATARNLWVPAVNNAATWGRWAFTETSNPRDAKNTIRACVRNSGQDERKG